MASDWDEDMYSYLELKLDCELGSRLRKSVVN